MAKNDFFAPFFVVQAKLRRVIPSRLGDPYTLCHENPVFFHYFFLVSGLISGPKWPRQPPLVLYSQVYLFIHSFVLLQIINWLSFY